MRPAHLAAGIGKIGEHSMQFAIGFAILVERLLYSLDKPAELVVEQ